MPGHKHAAVLSLIFALGSCLEPHEMTDEELAEATNYEEDAPDTGIDLDYEEASVAAEAAERMAVFDQEPDQLAPADPQVEEPPMPGMHVGGFAIVELREDEQILRLDTGEDELTDIHYTLEPGTDRMVLGDIGLGTISEVRAALVAKRTHSAVAWTTAARWPGGVVRWRIDVNAFTAHCQSLDMVSTIRNHMNNLASVWELFTPLTFVEDTTSTSGVIVFKPRIFNGSACADNVGGWSSAVGRATPGLQEIQLSECPSCTEPVNIGTVAHELWHAIGFFHGQSRADRDQHVVYDSSCAAPGGEGNFGIVGKGIFTYDIESISHYASFHVCKPQGSNCACFPLWRNDPGCPSSWPLVSGSPMSRIQWLQLYPECFIDAPPKSSFYPYLSKGDIAAIWSMYSPAPITQSNARVGPSASGDFDGDGLQDLAVAATGRNKILLYKGVPATPSAAGFDELYFIPWKQIDAPGVATLATGDLDNNGFDDLVVGYPNATVSGHARAGKIGVFFGNINGHGLTLTSPYTLNNPNPQADALFGWSIAVGKWDFGNNDDIAIGAPGQGGYGKVYMQNWMSNKWIEPPDDKVTDDGFGWSVAFGDIQGNGGPLDLVVGHPFENVGSVVDAGAVTVIQPQGLGATHYYESSAGETNEAGDWFGFSVAVMDIAGNGGAHNLIVGAPQEELPGQATNSGAVFAKTGTGWQFFGQGSLSTSSTNDRFGEYLAVGKLLNQAGPLLAVGVPNDAEVGGNVLLFQPNTSLQLVPYLKIRQNNMSGTNEAGDAFGRGLATARIGATDALLIGALMEDTSSGFLTHVDSGVLYMWHRPGSITKFRYFTPGYLSPHSHPPDGTLQATP